MNFRIFNQWGQEIFLSNTLSYGWDGTFKGNLQPTGVYMYFLKANLRNGEIVERKGSITLIR